MTHAPHADRQHRNQRERRTRKQQDHMLTAEIAAMTEEERKEWVEEEGEE